MINGRWWDRCIWHRGADAAEFTDQFFGDQARSVLLIAGAGFDPRARVVAERLAEACGDRLRLLLLRERRPAPSVALLALAEANIEHLERHISNTEVFDIDVFAEDGAVVGGRAAARKLDSIDLTQFTDIVVDVSALSVGLSFPAVRVILESVQAKDAEVNLHVMVVDAPQVDYAITSIASDQANTIEGFRSRFGRSDMQDAARLWLPSLRERYGAVMDRILKFVDPHTVCPILPFPATDPRRGDRLIAEYRSELESTWSVDPRDIIYAHESDPINLYRAILRIDYLRSRVFEDVGGSQIILAPTAGKLLNIGVMMAAIERDFPVVYVEAIGYDLQNGAEKKVSEHYAITHVWLHGEAYVQTES